jgi:hypothetical protein
VRPARSLKAGPGVVKQVENNHREADRAAAEVTSVEPLVSRSGTFAFDDERVDDHDHVMLERVLSADPPAGGPAESRHPLDGPGRGTSTFERNHQIQYLRPEAGAPRLATGALGATGRDE